MYLFKWKIQKWKFRNQHFILHLNYHIYMFLLINCKQCCKINYELNLKRKKIVRL